GFARLHGRDFYGLCVALSFVKIVIEVIIVDAKLMLAIAALFRRIAKPRPRRLTGRRGVGFRPGGGLAEKCARVLVLWVEAVKQVRIKLGRKRVGDMISHNTIHVSTVLALPLTRI